MSGAYQNTIKTSPNPSHLTKDSVQFSLNGDFLSCNCKIAVHQVTFFQNISDIIFLHCKTANSNSTNSSRWS